MMFQLLQSHWWWLVIPGILVGIYAQMRLNSTYGHYSQVPARAGISGAQAAREILDRAGLRQMPIQEVAGHLTDHYDPMRKKLCLSSENFHGTSLAALGVAAHEAGHALQHKAAYAPLNLRMALVGVTNIANGAAMFLGMFGIILGRTNFALAGVVIYAVILLFQLITLPVEYDASRRAKEQLYALGIVEPSENAGVSRVLNAAALTYVAAMVTTLLTLLHFIMILRGSNRDSR
jgi:Zn-dependent membrane protease YugP